MRPDGFVLAGGWSSRMGVDKARAPWHGWPMAIVVARVVASVCGRVVLVRRGAPDGLPWPWESEPALEVVHEADEGPRHPLWGVHTALSSSRTPVALVVPCDVPVIEQSLLEALVRAAPAVAVSEGRRHPLVGAFPREWADRARELAEEGASVRAFAAEATAVEARAASMLNVNGPNALSGHTLPTSLGFLSEGARARVLEGEWTRQQMRGILAPPQQTGYRRSADPESGA